ncbi:MAG: Cellulase [Nocardioides sp.]|nr:Cellulase [Nocardioides sp.]
MPSQPRFRLPQLVATAALAAGLLTGCGGGTDVAPPAATTSAVATTGGNPFAPTPMYADPDSSAALAAARAESAGDADRSRVFTRLARTPSGIWLTPEQYPPGQVGPFVGSVVAAAGGAGAVPLFVVYGIPDRDCTGGFSAGGLTVDEYGPWVQEIAAALAGAPAAVVLEPDALAAAISCGRRDQRVALITDALARLRTVGASTYVDGGHSHWVEPEALAALLREVGVDSIRGFATNVANYQTHADERRYAERLSGLLGGAHYVIDSGRNGYGSTDEWCNPLGRALGLAPESVDDGTGLDALLWVKPPGESDGECRGGPPAGEFWPDRALALAAASGW